jgi:glycosyltransferase involved in cell wall biosynthesis/SAM-dependent methyltransferase
MATLNRCGHCPWPENVVCGSIHHPADHPQACGAMKMVTQQHIDRVLRRKQPALDAILLPQAASQFGTQLDGHFNGQSNGHADIPPSPLGRRQSAKLVRDPRDSRLHLGIIGQICASGGAEEWSRLIANLTDRTKIKIVGFAFENARILSENRAKQLEKFAPLTFGREGILKVLSIADIAFIWGVQQSERFFPPRPRHCKIVGTAHGDTGSCYTANVMRSAHEFDGIVAVSRRSLDSIPDEHRGRASVIYNTIDRSRLVQTIDRDTLRNEWGIKTGQKVAGYLGRISSSDKNPRALVDALDLLPEHWVAVFVGDGVSFNEVSYYAKQKHPHRAKFLGHREDVGNCMRAFDTFVMPSFIDGFALVLLEAWLTRTPTIATRRGMIPECPGYAREIEPTPESVAEAIVADEADPECVAARVDYAYTESDDRFKESDFGKQWTDYATTLAGWEPPTPLETHRKDVQFWDRHGHLDPMWIIANTRSSEVWEERGRKCCEKLKVLCPDRARQTILEWGCGAGRVTRWIDREFDRVVAVDFSEVMIEHIRSLDLSRTTPTLISDNRLPDAVGPVDLVYSFATWMHCLKRDFPRIFDEIRRVLKPGGRVLFQLPLYESGRDRNKDGPSDVACWTKDELIPILNGFEIINLNVSPGKFMHPSFGPNHFDIHELRYNQ